ncbi:MAG: hypothetical protein KC505_02655, partial [Myxococcales bacterium]|nr:hypothetical protein [Myxococcales bacterium]
MSFLENNCFILCLSILLMAGCDTSSQTPQPRMITDSALPPVGIENKDSDCYLISLAQLILNSPDFLAAFKKVAHKNPIYSDLVEAYQKAQQEKTFLLTGEGSAFRKFKQYLHKLYGDDVCKPGASSAPGFVFLKIVPDILNATDNAWPPVIKTITTTTTKESGESKQESLDEYLLNYAGSDGASLDNSDSDMGQEIVKQFISREVVRFSKIPESIFFSANLAPCIKCFSFTMPNQMFNNIKEAEHGIQYKLS